MTDSDNILEEAIAELQEEHGIETVDEPVEIDSEKISYESNIPPETEGNRVHHTLCGEGAVETTDDG